MAGKRLAPGLSASRLVNPSKTTTPQARRRGTNSATQTRVCVRRCQFAACSGKGHFTKLMEVAPGTPEEKQARPPVDDDENEVSETSSSSESDSEDDGEMVRPAFVH